MYRRNSCSRKRNLKSWDTEIKPALPRIICVIWKVECQEMDIRRAAEGYAYSRREEELLHEELADRNELSMWNSHARNSCGGSIEECSRITCWWILEKKNDRGSRHYRRTHRKSSGIAERNQLYEWFRRRQGCWISAQWTNIPRSQWISVISAFDKSRRIAEPRQKFAARYLKYARYIGKRFWKFSSILFSTLLEDTQFMGWPNCEKGSFTGKYRDTRSWNEWSIQRHNSYTEISTKFVCQQFILPMEGRNFKNYGADQQRRQISEHYLDKFPAPQKFSCWKIRLKTEVCTCFNFSTEAMLWIKKVEMVNSVGWSKVFVFYSANHTLSWFWVARREDCISAEQI